MLGRDAQLDLIQEPGGVLGGRLPRLSDLLRRAQQRSERGCVIWVGLGGIGGIGHDRLVAGLVEGVGECQELVAGELVEEHARSCRVPLQHERGEDRSPRFDRQLEEDLDERTGWRGADVVHEVRSEHLAHRCIGGSGGVCDVVDLGEAFDVAGGHALVVAPRLVHQVLQHAIGISTTVDQRRQIGHPIGHARTAPALVAAVLGPLFLESAALEDSERAVLCQRCHTSLFACLSLIEDEQPEEIENVL